MTPTLRSAGNVAASSPTGSGPPRNAEAEPLDQESQHVVGFRNSIGSPSSIVTPSMTVSDSVLSDMLKKNESRFDRIESNLERLLESLAMSFDSRAGQDQKSSRQVPLTKQNSSRHVSQPRDLDRDVSSNLNSPSRSLSRQSNNSDTSSDADFKTVRNEETSYAKFTYGPGSHMETFPQQAILNQIQPPTFNGERSKARSWLREYDRIMTINGYTGDQKFGRAFAYLKDEAATWFDGRSVLEPNMDWYIFKNSFLEYFCGRDAILQLGRRLDEARQKPNEHPSTYMLRIISLCSEYDSNMPQKDILRRVTHGLSSEIFNHLATVKPEASWSIQWLDSIFKSYRSETQRNRETSQRNDQRKKSTSTPSTDSDNKSQPRNLDTWTCFNCDKKGHVIEKCTEPRDEARIKSKKEAHRAEKLSKREVNNVTANTLEKPQSIKQSHLPCDDVIKPLLTVKINNKSITGRIDTGADITIIPSNVAEELKLNLLPWEQPSLQAANKSNINVLGMTAVLVEYQNYRKTLLVAVVPKQSLTRPLWGPDLLKAFSMKLDFGQESKPVASTIVNVDNRETNSISTNCHPIDKVQFGDLKTEEKETIEKSLLQFADTFSKDDRDIGRTTTIKHRITLTDDKPVSKPPYRVAFRNRDAMEKELNRLLDTGAIRESKSPYASPVFFVDKDRGQGKRLVADFRALNAKTEPDRTPMPHPEDVFGMLAGMKVFAKLDITAMFNQIEVHEADIEKTAITTPFGSFECPLMPFGLINAPATAVKLMREVLRGLDGQISYVYFDDIIVFARNVPELQERCVLILDRLRKHNLKLKPSKCVFGVESVRFLGHVINSSGVMPDPRRIEDVKAFPTPRNPSDVRSFHGLCSYNRKFIRDFAAIAKPLTPLMGKPKDFVWSQEAQQAFETLRDALTKAPILVHFNPDAEHELRTDASNYAYGAVLYQKHPDPKQTGVVLYHSKSLTLTQTRYSASERELLAAFKSITELAHFLTGKRFTLVTDHAALSLLRNQKDPHKRMARWVAQLQCFDFNVVYKKGAEHLDADCMSRLIKYTPPEEDDEDDINVDINITENLARSIQQITGRETEPDQEEDDLGDVARDRLIDLRSEQEEDEFCRKYINILESTTLTNGEKNKLSRCFTIQNNQLHRIDESGELYQVVPKRRRAAILLSFHDSPLGAHLGFSRTYKAIKCRYYWPKMRRDIKKYVLSCLKCQRRKAINTRRQGYTKPLPIAEGVFDTMGIDLIVRLPKSYNGYTTILVCTDNLSKYAIAVPLKDETAETIIHAFFNNVVARFGCPKVVISDRGANLCGEQSRDFFRLFGIERNLTSGYHPQSNGQTERYNRTLKASLTTFVETSQKNWPDFIQAITFAYNITEHAVTRVTPYEVVFGRLPRLPIDNLMDKQFFIDPSRPEPGILSNYAMKLMKEQITKNQQANKRRLDARLASCSFKEGDLVLVERPERIKGTAHKLTYTYVGPYKIRRKISDLSFEIANIKGRSGCSVIHPHHLKIYIPREDEAIDDVVKPDFIPKERVLTIIDEIEQDSEEDDLESPPFEPLSPICSADVVGEIIIDNAAEEQEIPPVLSPIHSVGSIEETTVAENSEEQENPPTLSPMHSVGSVEDTTAYIAAEEPVAEQ